MGTLLNIHTLGGLTISIDDTPVTGFNSRKVQALLVYIACTQRTFPREVLAELFWEERAQGQASANLRVALTSLRQTVEPFVEITRESVGLKEGAEIDLDAHEFEALLSASSDDLAQIEAALDLYQGDFLAGFFVDSTGFEDWATRERERLRWRAMEALDTLITGCLAQAEYAKGIAAATRLIAMDPLREETHRQLMDLLWRSGQRGKALEQYDILCRVLDEEFGVTPLPETVALYGQLRAGDLTLPELPAAQVVVSPPARYVVLANPYKGLCAFDESDADDFFGREVLVDRLLARLAEDHPLARFLAVVGPSGSGKSSVVRAGVIPALRRGALPGSAEWSIVTLLPGSLPFDELEIALRRAFPDLSPTLFSDSRDDASSLLRTLRLCLPNDRVELLLVIDQFEEVFTLVSDPDEARRFLDGLYLAATTAHSPVRVLITLRADFYDRPLMIPDFSELVRQRTEVVTPMTPEELERAVTAPAERVGVSLESGLAAAVVAEVSQQPGALPLMEYALTEVFDRRTDHTLTLTAYEDVGGSLGALARRADQVFTRLSPERQAAARQMCLRLITLGEGTEDTRRRTLQSELLSTGGGATWAVLHAFDRARLLTFDRDPRAQQPTVELAHEAIIREWALLRTWLDESRDDVRLQRMLAAAAHEWQSAERDRSYLLSGSRLAQFEGWAGQTDVALTADEHAYLEASSAEQERLAQLEHERQVHEAQLRQRVQRVVQLLAGVFLVAAIIGIGLAVFSFDREQQAREARAKAEHEAAVNHSLVLSSAAQQWYTSGYLTLALLLAQEAVRMDQPPTEAYDALTSIAFEPGLRAILTGPSQAVRGVAFSLDGKQALSASCGEYLDGQCSDGELILWDMETNTEIKRLGGKAPGGHAAWINSVVFSPIAPGIALTGSDDGTLILWNVDTAEVIRRFEGHTAGVTSAAFAPDGRTFLSGSDDRTIILWNVDTGEILRRFEGHTNSVNAVAFSPDAQTFLSGSDDTTIIWWNIATGEIIRRFEGHTDKVTGVAFMPKADGQPEVILSVSYDFTFRAWQLTTGEEIHQDLRLISDCLLITPDGRKAILCRDLGFQIWDPEYWKRSSAYAEVHSRFLSGAISPDAEKVLFGTEGGSLYVIDMGAPQEEIRRFESGDPSVLGLAVSPDGRRLLTGAEGEATLWDIDSARPIRRYPVERGIAGILDFSPDGHTAVIGTSDWLGGTTATSLMLVNVGTGEVTHHLEGHEFYVRAAAFSPDGRFVLTGSQQYPLSPDDPIQGDLILWDVASGEIVRRFDDVDSVTDVEFSQDGSRVLTSSSDPRPNGVILWNVASGSPIRSFNIPGISNEGFFNVVLGPGEQTVLATTGTGKLILWDIETGEIIPRFAGHTEWATGLDISPDGKYVLSGQNGGIMILWDFASGRELRRWQADPAWVWDIAFSPDGQTAFSGPLWGQWVSQWQITAPSLDEVMSWIAENRYVRDFTCEERAQYRIEPLCE